MGTWVGGQFDPGQFDPKQFDTGAYVDDETMAPPDAETIRKFRLYEQVKREDDEILAILIGLTKSGLFDE